MYYTESLCLEAGVSHFIRVFEEAAALKPRVLATKRLLDVLAASLGLALLAVPMMIILVLVRVKLGSPGIFRQMRPGRDGEPFQMFKFRTMTDERDPHGNLLPDGQRLTGIGHLLRSTSLDELPELWNVLVGDMSLVGPRPLLMRYTPYFTDEEATRLSVRPGITGWAQINGRNRSSWDSRLASDVWYVRHLSIWLDVKILLRTLFGIFGGNDVVVDAESEMQNLDDERMARPS
ncbi:MAG: sugar transferase [Kineosporiaceae bacterium]|nr:sugar transferase [Aeromicrobium sp.]